MHMLFWWRENASWLLRVGDRAVLTSGLRAQRAAMTLLPVVAKPVFEIAQIDIQRILRQAMRIKRCLLRRCQVVNYRARTRCLLNSKATP